MSLKRFNLKEEILKEHSKAQRDIIISWVGVDQARFDQLIRLFLHDDYRVTQRAAWALSYCVLAHPPLINSWLPALVENLRRPGLHNAVKRNTVRILQEIAIPESLQGEVMNICFQLVESPFEAVAIKAFSLSVLGNLAKQYPDIIPEIKILIEAQLPYQSPAFISRAKRVLKMIEEATRS